MKYLANLFLVCIGLLFGFSYAYAEDQALSSVIGVTFYDYNRNGVYDYVTEPASDAIEICAFGNGTSYCDTPADISGDFHLSLPYTMTYRLNAFCSEVSYLPDGTMLSYTYICWDGGQVVVGPTPLRIDAPVTDFSVVYLPIMSR